MASDSNKEQKKTSSMKFLLRFVDWTVKETCQYLEKEGLGKWAKKFKEHEITGNKLLGLTDDDLKKMGIEEPMDREKILRCISKLWQIPGKVINDPIHGHMELHPLLIEIIDTPQFQRLRNIKQLGGVYYVYPGASHNRFEHSIGVAHLAGELLKSLRARQPELGITHRDVLCVQIAGLCHDLGHGPFSHMFDSMFIPKVHPNTKWKHEDASCAMFDYLVKNNELKQVMTDYGLKLPKDLVFIKEMIAGPLYSKAEEQLQAAFQVLKGKVKTSYPQVELQYDPAFIKEIIAGLLDNITAEEQLQAVFQVLKEKLKTDHDMELQYDTAFIKDIMLQAAIQVLEEEIKTGYPSVELQDDLASIKETIAGLLDITDEEKLQAAFQALEEKMKTRYMSVELQYHPAFIKKTIAGLLDNITDEEKLQAAFRVLKEKVKMDQTDVEPTFIENIIVKILENFIIQKQLQAVFQVLKGKVKTRYPQVELQYDPAFIKEIIARLLDNITTQEQLQAVFQVLKGKVKTRYPQVELQYDPAFIKEIIARLLDNITTQEQLQAAFQVLKDKMKTDHDVELQDDTTFIKDIMIPFWLVKEKMVKAYGMELPDDLAFIKKVIEGLVNGGAAQEQWPYKGRDKEMSFLYDIVANKKTGIDVDKFDYFARDCYHLGLQNNFDHHRFLKFVRVCKVEDNGKKQICIRDKEVFNLYNMFHTRYCIHRRACQHRVSSIIQTMMADAFVKAHKYIKIEGSHGNMFTLSGAIHDMEAYTKLTDCVFELILNFPPKDLKRDQKRDMDEAKQILHRIITRDLYRCLGEIGIKLSAPEERVCNALKGELNGLALEGLEPGDFEVVFVSMDYGMKHKDPIKEARFYSKDEPNKGVKRKREQVSNLLPTYFSDDLMRFYWKKKTAGMTLKAAERNFERWWEECKNKVRSSSASSSSSTTSHMNSSSSASLYASPPVPPVPSELTAQLV